MKPNVDGLSAKGEAYEVGLMARLKTLSFSYIVLQVKFNVTLGDGFDNGGQNKAEGASDYMEMVQGVAPHHG